MMDLFNRASIFEVFKASEYKPQPSGI